MYSYDYRIPGLLNRDVTGAFANSGCFSIADEFQIFNDFLRLNNYKSYFILVKIMYLDLEYIRQPLVPKTKIKKELQNI